MVTFRVRKAVIVRVGSKCGNHDQRLAVVDGSNHSVVMSKSRFGVSPFPIGMEHSCSKNL
jgi:hypothetical protein